MMRPSQIPRIAAIFFVVAFLPLVTSADSAAETIPADHLEFFE